MINNRVLIIGFGRIGQMKAKQWKNLNCDVYVYDTDVRSLMKARKSRYTVVDNLNQEIEYMDICVPTAFHAKYIMDERITVLKKIVVEKPIVSNKVDWELLNNYARKFPDRVSKIIVSEQYYYSNALKYVKNAIPKDGIRSIRIKMNKDRTQDNLNGRFMDRDLQSYGIELPHMIAMLDFFNIDFSKIDSKFKNDFFLSDTELESGCKLEGFANQVHYYLESFLGKFIYNNQQKSFYNIVDREVIIRTDNGSYIIKLDPIKGLKRYKSIIIFNGTKFELEDNMLKNMIFCLINSQSNIKSNFHNAMNIALVLINLKNNAANGSVSAGFVSYTKEIL